MKPKTDTSELYAAYPHLQKIDGMWGTPQCRHLLNDLLSDSRGGTRQGFPPEHASTIFRLLQEHDVDFAHLDDDPMSVSWWEQNPGHRQGPR